MPRDLPSVPLASWGDRSVGPLEWARARGNGALADTMGFEWLEFTDEQCSARMPVAGNTQPVGLFHGGAYVVLGESLGSMHANWHAGPGRLAVGVDINATHTRSATSGYVTGVCTPIHLGRTLMVHEIEVTDDAGHRCSTVRITNLVTDLPPQD
ncbi:PaaI family thioesterase [Microbacterium sp.]|uniref:PaaI family thioesterase n=1 Tax=Microbacterium sp. TaxID=51671 RepID=UPI003A92288D